MVAIYEELALYKTFEMKLYPALDTTHSHEKEA
jgi:hypothetical protein